MGPSESAIPNKEGCPELSMAPEFQQQILDWMNVRLYLHVGRKILLTRIAGRARVTQDGADTITLNRAEQYILKDTVTKFIFGLKGPHLCLRMDRVQSRTNAQSLQSV